MKTLLTIFISLFFSLNLLTAQDTLYVHKSGIVIDKCAINDLDSMSFRYIPPQTGTLTDIDGNTYRWIKIGSQTWMAENLKTTKFRSGESISNLTDGLAYHNATFAAWCDYDNNPTNGSKYGHLYNWYAVNDTRKIAPIGWHVPSDNEWTILTNYLNDHLGISLSIGQALAANYDWSFSSTIGNVGNNFSIQNSSGFTALPGGVRMPDTVCSFGGMYGLSCWWSTTSYDANLVWSINLTNIDDHMHRDLIYAKFSGLSVRCIKD